MESELARFKSHAFALKQTRCVACGLALERPAVYFRCGHCFHKACVDLTKRTCPKCEESAEPIKSERLDSDSLIQQLKQSPNGFAFAADCFGKDLFHEEEASAEFGHDAQAVEEFREGFGGDDDEDIQPEDITHTLELWSVCYKQSKDEGTDG